MLTKNKGRDISKFFYGGYQLVNDGTLHQHTHSPVATKIAQEMTIALLKDQTKVQTTVAVIGQKVAISGNSAVIVMEELTGQKTEAFSLWQPDVHKLGQAFLIYSKAEPRHKRFYSVCNYMRPQLRTEINKMLELLIEDKQAEFGLDLLDPSESRFQYFCIKKYPNITSLAAKMHKIKVETYANMMPLDNQIYLLKGPMGPGIQAQENGLHIAFVAGTGMLTIMDLVARQILEVTGIIPPEERQLQKDFKLVIFSTFYSRQAKYGW